MNENIDLTQILRDCPIGTKLYSPIFGEVKFNGLDLEDTYPISVIITSDNDFQEFTKEGLNLAYNDGECLIFPSKEQRDWSKFKLPKKDLPNGTLVMTSDDGRAWNCNNYDHDGFVIGSTKIWRYIISLADFKGIPFNSEENYGKDLNSHNEHEYVDLGLSVKWATCNVGASSPSGYGNYYAWGETTTKSDYSISTSTTYGKNMGDISGNSRYDAARANWGGTWRLPTAKEIDELVNNCTWKRTSRGGVNGYKVTGKNGNSIFLPATGCRYGSSLSSAGSGGYYWSSTPDSGTHDACSLYFDSSHYDWDDGYGRYYGHSVRPVTE